MLVLVSYLMRIATEPSRSLGRYPTILKTSIPKDWHQRTYNCLRPTKTWSIKRPPKFFPTACGKWSSNSEHQPGIFSAKSSMLFRDPWADQVSDNFMCHQKPCPMLTPISKAPISKNAREPSGHLQAKGTRNLNPTLAFHP